MDVLSFDDAEEVIQRGYDGKWINVSADDSRRIVKSIAGINLIRGTKGQPYLESYQDRGLLLVVQHFSGIERHPLDIKKKEETIATVAPLIPAAVAVMNNA